MSFPMENLGKDKLFHKVFCNLVRKAMQKHWGLSSYIIDERSRLTERDVEERKSSIYIEGTNLQKNRK